MFICHVESMKAVTSYSAAAIGISWISSTGCIWSFHARARFGLRMEIYYWARQGFNERYAQQLQLLSNRDFNFILIYRAALPNALATA